jgi:hypothetical protein
MKYLGTNLTKEVKDFYNENYKTLKKILIWIGRIKMVRLPKVIYRFNAISMNIPMTFFIEIIQNFIWKYKMLTKAHAILTKNSNTRDAIILIFKLY